MKTKITAGLSEGEQKELTREFKASKTLRLRLTSLLTKEIGVLYDSMLKEDEYEKENWELSQVDKIAQVKALKKLISLIEN